MVTWGQRYVGIPFFRGRQKGPTMVQRGPFYPPPKNTWNLRVLEDHFPSRLDCYWVGSSDFNFLGNHFFHYKKLNFSQGQQQPRDPSSGSMQKPGRVNPLARTSGGFPRASKAPSRRGPWTARASPASPRQEVQGVFWVGSSGARRGGGKGGRGPMFLKSFKGGPSLGWFIEFRAF